MTDIKESLGDGDGVIDVVGSSLNKVDMIMNQVVKYHLVGCHLVLVTTTNHNTMFPSILR